MKTKKIIALIMARKGSKSIPYKNIKLLHGFPLIAWTIAAAKLSKKIDRIIVSTDDKKIAKIAEKFGAEIPFLRPKQFAKDNSTDFEVLNHFLKWYGNFNQEKIKMIIHLRPTTPFRKPEIIDKAIEIFEKKINQITGLRSVYELPDTSWKNFEMDRNKNLVSLINISKRSNNTELSNLPRQKYKKTFRGQGYVDIVKPSVIKKGQTFGNKIHGFLTSDVGDIDSLDQLLALKKDHSCRKLNVYKYLKKAKFI